MDPSEWAEPAHGRPPASPPMDTTWRSYVAEAPAWALVVGAMAVSFWSQVEVVTAHSFAGWEGLIFGASSDFGTVACLFMAREGAHRGTPTWGAWALSVGCAAVSVEYNVVRSWGDWLGVEAHLWMPIFALGVWWWLLHGRHRRWAARLPTQVDADDRSRPVDLPAVPVDPQSAARPDELDGRTDRIPIHTSEEQRFGRPRTTRPRRRSQAEALAHFAGRAPTWQDVRDWAGVPRSTAQRWAAQMGRETAA